MIKVKDNGNLYFGSSHIPFTEMQEKRIREIVDQAIKESNHQ